MNKLVLISLLAGMAAAQATAGETPASPVPVVVELFTSEGCSSCPPADRLLAELDRSQPISGVQLIVLSEHVDYWNTLGWIDPYSSMEFSDRQRHYGEALHVEDVYTPQAVIDGRSETVGNSPPKVEAAIQQALREKKIPLKLQVTRTAQSVHVELRALEAVPRGAQIYFALAEDSVESKVSSGENGGHMLTHTAVVRSLTKAGKLAAAGDAGVTMDLKTNARWGKHMRVVALLAEREGGKIIGAALEPAILN